MTGLRILAVDCFDVRFPTSREHHGSDAMNPDPDYSAAYVVLRTDPGAPDGHAICFTIGRGNDIVVTAIEALRPHLVGRPVADIVTNLGGLSAGLTSDSQLRWLGPDKGVMHMAIGAVVNAAWDLAAKLAGQPLWRLLADMTPEELVALVDFRYIDDALTPAEALDILLAAQPGRGERIAALLDGGYPAYTTTPGWIGYLAPSAPGFSATLRPESLRDYQFPDGPVWQDIARGVTDGELTTWPRGLFACGCAPAGQGWCHGIL